MHKQVGHMLRWAGELLIIWTLVLPETGAWTCIVLMMITVGIEFDHFNKDDWR